MEYTSTHRWRCARWRKFACACHGNGRSCSDNRSVSRINHHLARWIVNGLYGAECHDELEGESHTIERSTEAFPIYPRTPQPRKRKVNVFDLLGALEKALEVKTRRENRLQTVEISAPEKKVDISIVLADLFSRIVSLFKKAKLVTFNSLLQTDTKEEKIRTIIPLLYLSNEQKIRLQQDTPFGEIHIHPIEATHAQQK